MVRVKKWDSFLGPKFRFLVQKSDFCHTTPILVNGLFVALGGKFLTSYLSYGRFRKRKPGRRAKKSSPSPLLSASNSRSALNAQALHGRAGYQRQGQLHAFIRDKLIAWVGFWVHGTMNLSTEILEVDRLVVLVLEVVVEETLGPLGCTIHWNSHTQGNGHLRLLRRRPGTCTLLVTIYYALVQELNRVLVSLRIPGIVKKTLPKAQRTRGLSSSCQSHIASSNTNLDWIWSSESWLSIN